MNETEKYYVIDCDGHVSWHASDSNPDDDGPEYFETFDDAVERARELSTSSPGEDITICKAVSTVLTPLGQTSVTDF